MPSFPSPEKEPVPTGPNLRNKKGKGRSGVAHLRVTSLSCVFFFFFWGARNLIVLGLNCFTISNNHP